MKKVFKYITASNFFKDYCPKVKSYKDKMAGYNRHGTEIGFTDEDNVEIEKGIDKFYKDVKKGKFKTTIPKPKKK